MRLSRSLLPIVLLVVLTSSLLLVHHIRHGRDDGLRPGSRSHLLPVPAVGEPVLLPRPPPLFARSCAQPFACRDDERYDCSSVFAFSVVPPPAVSHLTGASSGLPSSPSATVPSAACPLTENDASPSWRTHYFAEDAYVSSPMWEWRDLLPVLRRHPRFVHDISKACLLLFPGEDPSYQPRDGRSPQHDPLAGANHVAISFSPPHCRENQPPDLTLHWWRRPLTNRTVSASYTPSSTVSASYAPSSSSPLFGLSVLQARQFELDEEQTRAFRDHFDIALPYLGGWIRGLSEDAAKLQSGQSTPASGQSTLTGAAADPSAGGRARLARTSKQQVDVIPPAERPFLLGVILPISPHVHTETMVAAEWRWIETLAEAHPQEVYVLKGCTEQHRCDLSGFYSKVQFAVVPGDMRTGYRLREVLSHGVIPVVWRYALADAASDVAAPSLLPVLPFGELIPYHSLAVEYTAEGHTSASLLTDARALLARLRAIDREARHRMQLLGRMVFSQTLSSQESVVELLLRLLQFRFSDHQLTAKLALYAIASSWHDDH